MDTVIEVVSFNEAGEGLDINGDRIVVKKNTTNHTLHPTNEIGEQDKLVATITIIND